MTLILVLVFISFLQSTLLSTQIILMIIIARSFLVSDRTNYWLAFGLGLLVALLTNIKLGTLGIVYLLAVILVYFIKERSVGSHWLILLPITVLMLLLDALVKRLVVGSSVEILPLLRQVILILPIYLCLRMWEERFVVKKEIRLRVGK